MEKMNKQQQRILKFIKNNGCVTSRDAFLMLGISNPTAVITKMRKAGIPIITQMQKGINRYGEPVHFAQWYLADSETRGASC